MLRTYIIYNSILLLTILFSIAVTKSRNRTSEYIARTMLFLCQAIPVYIKKGIGTDYSGYKIMYRTMRRIDDGIHEAGFQFMARLVENLGGNYHVFIGLVGIIPLFLIAYFIPKQRYHYFAIIYFLSCYTAVLGVSRQQISVALIAVGTVYLSHNYGNIKYLITAGIASLFHTSAFLYFPVLLLKNIKIGPKSAMMFLIAVVLVGLSSSVFNVIFTNSLFLQSRFSVYLETDYIREAKAGTGLGVLLNIIIPLLFLIFYNKSSKYTDSANFKCWLSLCFIFSYLLASQIHIFGRLMNVFQFVPALIVFPTCKAISSRRPGLILCGFAFLYIVFFERMIMISQSSLGSGLGISPFKCIFD